MSVMSGSMEFFSWWNFPTNQRHIKAVSEMRILCPYVGPTSLGNHLVWGYFKFAWAKIGPSLNLASTSQDIFYVRSVMFVGLHLNQEEKLGLVWTKLISFWFLQRPTIPMLYFFFSTYRAYLIRPRPILFIQELVPYNYVLNTFLMCSLILG